MHDRCRRPSNIPVSSLRRSLACSLHPRKVDACFSIMSRSPIEVRCLAPRAKEAKDRAEKRKVASANAESGGGSSHSDTRVSCRRLPYLRSQALHPLTIYRKRSATPSGYGITQRHLRWDDGKDAFETRETSFPKPLELSTLFQRQGKPSSRSQARR